MAEEKKLSRENVSLIVAVTAVVVSVASFYAAYVQSVAATRQVKAATWPYLQVDHGDIENGRLSVSYRLQNVGVGPLFLRSFRLEHEGEAISNLPDLIRACCTEGAAAEALLASSFSNVASPRIIPAGDEIILFRSDRSDVNSDAWAELARQRWELDFRACFCSILKECWTLEKDTEPQPVNACPANRASDSYWQ